jgi:hypothetical protein
MATPVRSTRRRLAPRRLALHAEALAAIVLASLAIRLLPFPRVVSVGARPRRRQGAAADVAALRGPVRGWGNRVPWRALCFETAVALRMMLARRGIGSTLHYGIARDEGLKAHVWLSVGENVVIGGREAADYPEVARFPQRPPR